MTFTFKVEKREGKLKEKDLCMGVVYGPKMESTSLKFNRKDFKKLLAEAGHSNIISLEGLGKPVEVTIHEVERAPFTHEIHHVNFFALEKGAEMHADVPLIFVNEAPAQDQGAIINQLMEDVSITCKPQDLIHEIEVDLSKLVEVGDSIHIKDLSVPATIKVNLDPEAVVVSALAAKEEPELETALEAEGEAVEAEGGEVQPEEVKKEESE